MLIIPVSRSPDWRNPPVITLLLVLLNFLIYFGLQTGDHKREEKSLSYYAASSLRSIELPRYVSYLRENGRPGDATKADRLLKGNNWPFVWQEMEHDKPFMARLRGGKIITPEEEDYASWRRQRENFDKLASTSIIDRFGFKPAEPTIAGFVGHMFLHGSFDHLLGNMAIFFIVGYMVEEALGKRRFLAFYLLSGLGAAAFDLIINGDRTIPGIGASGAVSGVMAMFVVLYGMRRIRFFYWVLFYFNFFRAPAIVVLPFWIANELYQYFFSHGSPVNYIAHLGGFVTGAALVAAQQAYGKASIAAPTLEAVIDPVPAELARIDALLVDLRVTEATQALGRLAAADPHNPALLARYYRLARNEPASDDFHQAAALIFALPEQQEGNEELLHSTFVEYLKLAKPTVRFRSAQLATLIRKLARAGHVEDAERLTKALSRRAPNYRQLPDLLLLVAECFRRHGNETRHREMLAQLQSNFPETAAAQTAAGLYR